MLLRNKKTGKIVKLQVHHIAGKCYESLAELNAEWEDTPEEPKEYWFVNDLDGKPMKCELRYCPVRDFTEWSEKRKQIGNYFETREEAEKAVEKLKAWKQLDDKGFRFEGYDGGHNSNRELCGQAYFKAGNFWSGIKEALDLLFGDEE